VYSSPLLRAKHTADILSQYTGLDVSTVPGLKERDAEKESDQESLMRFVLTLSDLLARHEGETFLVVAHGLIMRLFLDYVGYADIENMPMGYVGNTGYVKFLVKKGQYQAVETSRVGENQKLNQTDADELVIRPRITPNIQE
jgi:broad specificity phosphatase PhoE